MRQVYDFSNVKFHCSTLYNLIAPGKTLTPKQKYSQLQTILADEMRKYDEMGERKQGMANGLKKASKIAGIEYDLKLLEPKKHIDPISATAKSLLKRYYGFLKYGKWSVAIDKGNKYTNKGQLGENDSIALINFLDGTNCMKNEDTLEDEFLIGIPDINHQKDSGLYIIDVKTSWDWDTFSENLGEELNPVYFHQLQGYMSLTGATKGEVSYCLVDTPESIVNDEIMWLAKRVDAISTESPSFLAKRDELVNNLTFSDIPAMERRIKFEVFFDPEAMMKIYEAIPKMREFLFEIQEMHLTGKISKEELVEIE